MKYFFLIALLFFQSAFSQNLIKEECTKELLRQKAGIWKAGMNGAIVNVNAADLVKEKAVTAGIHKMISSGYSPKGCQVLYSSSFGKSMASGQTWIADPYYYSMYLLRYLCDQQSADKSKFYIDYSTPTTVNITANVIFSLNNLYAADLGDDFRGYLKLTRRPEKKDGFYFMGEEKIDYNSPIYEYRWLITYNDTLPFYYVSQKEYLLIQRKRLEKDIQNSPGEKKYFDKYISTIDEYLKKSDDQLKQPAICMWNEEEKFEKFVEEGSRGSFIAVKPNPDYYRKKLAKSTPQFFTVVYKLSKGDPVFEENISSIQKAVDFAALRNMLGK